MKQALQRSQRREVLVESLDRRVMLAAEMVKDIQPGALGSVDEVYWPGMVESNGALYFRVAHNDTHEIWKTDGTAAATMEIAPGKYSFYPEHFTDVNGTVFFADGNHKLWKTDGTAAGTSVIADEAFFNDEQLESLVNLTNQKGAFYFEQEDYTGGMNTGRYFVASVWKSDGTPQGTTKVFSGPIEDYRDAPFGSVMLGDTIYFAGSKDFQGDQLWKSDGTSAGTSLVKDVRLFNLASANGKLYFSADSYPQAPELWISDGTPSGTVLLKKFGAGDPDGELSRVVSLGGRSFFTYSNASDYGLWITDGTTQGTERLKAFSETILQSAVVLGGKVVFLADDGVHGYQLWITDGTAAGTKTLKGFSASSPLLKIRDTLYFVADDGKHGYELWKTDGTTTGTALVKDIRSGSRASSPMDFINVNGTLYFTADDGTHGRELWKTDGTAEGTQLVHDVRPGSATSNPSNFVEMNGALYFIADDGAHGTELWKIDFASLDAGVLCIQGTESADTIGLTIRSGLVRVRSNGAIRTFPQAAIKRIEISGLEGNDVIDCSGVSIPTYVDAGPGNDRVTCGAANDSITGGSGKDTLYGGEGDDRINGKGTQDKLYGQGGADRIYGGDHNDFIDGGSGVDRIWGDAGSDTIVGGASNDKLFGGEGDDQITGGPGADNLSGDSGDDIFFTRDTIADSLDGGDGSDSVLADTVLDVLLRIEVQLN